MNGIASLLDKISTAHVESLWQELEASCGLSGVRVMPFPHFTWQVTERFDLSRLEKVLREISQQTQPFTIHTAGIGIFTGENPIIYITIVKEESLICFHEMLWKHTNKLALNPNHHYSPDHWVPHITLSYNDVRPDNLSCALLTLAFQPFIWEIQIDNLVFVAQEGDQTIETINYRFGN